jgi:hypothetical protein
VAEEDDASARGDGVVEKVENLGGVLHRAGQGYSLHHDAVALGFQVPGMLPAGMLLVGHEHFIAWPQVDAIGDMAISLGGITEQGNLVAMAADESGQRIAEFVPCGISPDGIVFRIVLVHFFSAGITVENGAQHGRGTGTNGAIVQVNFVFGDEELCAHLSPVSIFVFVEEGGIRKLGGDLGKLGEQIPAQCSRSGEAGGGGGQETAAIEQRVSPADRKDEAPMLRLCWARGKGGRGRGIRRVQTARSLSLNWITHGGKGASNETGQFWLRLCAWGV